MNKKKITKRKDKISNLFLHQFPEYNFTLYHENTDADDKNLFFKFTHDNYPVYIEDLYENNDIIAIIFDKTNKNMSILEDKKIETLLKQMETYIEKENLKIKINK
ncbi:MAG: hypothetical protein ACOCVF_02065 [bacterium]